MDLGVTASEVSPEAERMMSSQVGPLMCVTRPSQEHPVNIPLVGLVRLTENGTWSCCQAQIA